MRRARVALAFASAAGALSCREGQPALEPKPAPDTPLPRIERPQEGTPRKAGGAPESSGPQKPPSAAPTSSAAPRDAGA